MTFPHLALVLAINLLFGLNIVVVKVGVAEIQPILFSALRFLILAVVLLPFIKWHKGQMRTVLAIGVIGGAVHFAMVFLGLFLSTNVSAAAIGMQMVVPFATILSIVFLGEVVRWKRWTGITLAFGGVVIIAFDPAVLQDLTGLLVIIGGALAGAVGMLLMKRISGIKVFEIQAWFALVSAPLLLGVSLLVEQGHWQQLTQASSSAWLALAYTSFGASLLGHGGFYFLIQRYDVSVVAPTTILATIFAIVFGVVLLGDLLTAKIVLGGVAALFGVVMITLRQKAARIAAPVGGSLVRKRKSSI